MSADVKGNIKQQEIEHQVAVLPYILLRSTLKTWNPM